MQQDASKSAQVAIAVGPHPRPGLHVNVDLVSSPEEQNRPVGSVVSDVGGCRVLGRADDDLAVLVQEQEARPFSVSVRVECEVVKSVDRSREDA